MLHASVVVALSLAMAPAAGDAEPSAAIDWLPHAPISTRRFQSLPAAPDLAPCAACAPLFPPPPTAADHRMTTAASNQTARICALARRLESLTHALWTCYGGRGAGGPPRSPTALAAPARPRPPSTAPRGRAASPAPPRRAAAPPLPPGACREALRDGSRVAELEANVSSCEAQLRACSLDPDWRPPLAPHRPLVPPPPRPPPTCPASTAPLLALDHTNSTGVLRTARRLRALLPPAHPMPPRSPPPTAPPPPAPWPPLGPAPPLAPAPAPPAPPSTPVHLLLAPAMGPCSPPSPPGGLGPSDPPATPKTSVVFSVVLSRAAFFGAAAQAEYRARLLFYARLPAGPTRLTVAPVLGRPGGRRPARLSVTAHILRPASPLSVLARLQQLLEPTAASAALGVAVEAVAQPFISTLRADAPTPPPPPPSAPPPFDPDGASGAHALHQANRAAPHLGVLVGVAVVVGAVAPLAALAALAACHRSKRDKRSCSRWIPAALSP